MWSILISFLLLSPPAFSLDPERPVSQYNHFAWRVSDGAFTSGATTFAQSQDGYVWIGTRSGAYRFDGKNFLRFTGPAGQESLRSPVILSSLAQRDGSLWFGTGSDLERYKDGVLTHYPVDRGRVLSYFMNVTEARDGTVWVNRARLNDADGPLCKVSVEKLVCYGAKQGIAAAYLSNSILEDGDGTFWLNSDQAIIHWNPRTLQALPGGIAVKAGVESIQALAKDANGAIVVALEGAALFTLVDGAFKPYPLPDLAEQNIGAQQLFLDSHGALWIGTEKQGLYRLRGEHLDHYGIREGLSSDTVNGFAEDREGNVWILTSQGVDRFRDQKVITYSALQGLSGDLVNGVKAGADGTVWIDNTHGIDILKEGTIRSIKMPSPSTIVYGVFEDQQGRLWAGIDKTLSIYSNGKFEAISPSSGLPIGAVQAIAQERNGIMWVVAYAGGAHAKLLRVEHDHIAEEIGFDVLPIAFSSAIAPDPVDGVWLALANGDVAHSHDGRFDVKRMQRPPNSGNTTGLVARRDGSIIESNSAGLVGWRDGRVQWLTEKNGIPCRFIMSIVAGSDALWAYGDCGIFSVSDAELARWWKDPDARLKFSLYDALDGAQPASPAFFPRASSSPDGKIWFANHTVLQMIDPAHSAHNSVPPIIHMERLIADRTEYPLTSTIRVPALTREMHIDYSAASFSIPERVRFQYQLQGHDENWVDADARRQAFYADLKPGTYRFHVKASNEDGVWNEMGQATTIVVPPAFYQTRTFLLVCVVFAIVLIRVIYAIRLRQLGHRIRLRTEAKVSERERIARDLHDTLLQGIQGLIYKMAAIAERLPPAEPNRVAMEGALDRAESVLVEGRDQLTSLRRYSLAESSLADALTAIAHDLQEQTPSEFRLSAQGVACDLTPRVREELYRIGSEALINAFRYSSASLIEAEFLYDEKTFTLRVRDNGQGFDERALQKSSRPGHFGLIGLRERAKKIGGVLDIWSRDGAGTEVSCTVPAQDAYAHLATPVLRNWVKRFWSASEDFT